WNSSGKNTGKCWAGRSTSWNQDCRIIRDLGEIHSRLLDHRPVIQGETRYFVKEFEEKHCKQLLTPSVDSSRGNRSEKRFIVTF
uniref:Biogenesis of lysosome-related organelles complex 1 subunit 5 n=1 Tax=Capra hircus TaxID=9925 RepID=A0A452FCM4_CAPHI